MVFLMVVFFGVILLGKVFMGCLSWEKKFLMDVLYEFGLWL